MAFLKTSKNCLRASHLRLAASLAAVVAAAELSHPAAAKTYAELLQFNGTNGAGPQSGVLFDGGVLYGVTAGGGSAGDGVVYSLSPLANGQWSFNVIYNFLGGTLDGATPIGGLVADASGILYGTTSAAGGAGQGTVFQLIPPSTPAGTWTEKTLYNFQGGANDGSAPLANLIIDTEGNLYGATSAGGAAGEGVVFELSPPKSAGGEWTETVLYAFKGGASDGSTPTAGPTFGPQGALYGTTIGGGALGLGVAFELAPPSGSTTTWTETILFDFLGFQGGGGPEGGVALGRDGALYGAAETQGSKGWGVVYKLAPPTSGQTLWTESDLHEFTGESDGGFPVGPIVIGTNGALYGVTAAGGGPLGAGTIYELKPPAAGKTKWTFSTLYKFQVASDGATPLGGVIFGAKGALFGTTSAGGSNGAGLVFELQ